MSSHNISCLKFNKIVFRYLSRLLDLCFIICIRIRYLVFKEHLEGINPSKINSIQKAFTDYSSASTKDLRQTLNAYHCLLRKEVIQPHLPIRLPCYDFTPIIDPAFGRVLLTVRLRTSGITDSHGVTGGVYKARERIHRDILIRDY